MADLDSLAAIFKAYDVRGVVPDELDAPLAERIGAAFARFVADADGAARVVELGVEPGRLTARVEAESRAVIATSQPSIPGWRLTRNGEAFESLRINGAFLGAAVEPGVSRLEWLYAPRTWRWGWWLLAVGLVAAVGIPLGFRRLQQ